MGVYYKIACDEVRENIRPNDINAYHGIRRDEISSPENPFCALAIFAMTQIWDGRSCRIVNDADDESEDAYDNYKDITEKAIEAFNKKYSNRSPLKYTRNDPPRYRFKPQSEKIK